MCGVGGKGEWLCLLLQKFRFCLRVLALEETRDLGSLAADVIAQLRAQGLTRADCGDLEKHAYAVNDAVSDPQLRNLHVLAGV